MRRIEGLEDIEAGLGQLLASDARLKGMAEIAGPLPLRLRPGGFEGLAAIVNAQQISEGAARSIWARLEAAVAPFTFEQFLLTDPDALRAAGLSRPKVLTLTAAATACAQGLVLEALHDLPADEAIAKLTALKGVGPWTAEIYLLFCAGHPDIFPAGDLALQVAAQHGLQLERRPSEKALRGLAAAWSPWRGIAARLFWAFYRAQRGAVATAPRLLSGL